MTHTDLFLIKEGNIFLPATKWYEEREIAEVQDNNAQQMIDTLSEKFAELVKEVEELKKEFDLSEDKIKWCVEKCISLQRKPLAIFSHYLLNWNLWRN
jgi:predicted transcriptional regulator